jgi:hypothetical protein
MRRAANLFLVAALAASVSACSGANTRINRVGATTSPAAAVVAAGSQVAAIATRTAATKSASATAGEGLNVEVAADAAQITLNGNSIKFSGSGATVDGSTITITQAGTYRISGKLSDGQIIVDTQDAEKVVLALDGADIASATSSPIYVANAEKVVITLVTGSQNTVTDGKRYTYLDTSTDEPDATIFSHDDLTINGAGSLTVNANYNNGIASKDDLKITGGTITVTAVNDAVKGRDSLVVKAGTLTVKAGGDALQASNDEEADQGYIVIEGGTIKLTAGDDALNAVTSIEVDGGKLNISAGDDALHADGAITINGGVIVVAKSYEGIESDQIIINNGEVSIVSSDDAINGVSPNGEGGGMGGGTSRLTINGGTIIVDALGDGLDINGGIDMAGGTLLVNGPVANNNGPLDYDGTFNMTGGYLVAAGSAGMAQAPSATSSQYALLHVFNQMQAAGTTVRIISPDGEEIASFTPTKKYQSIVVSSPKLVKGGTYLIYSGNTQVASYTLTSMITGARVGGMMGGRGMRPSRP